MRKLCFVVSIAALAGAALAGGPVLAQPAPQTTMKPQPRQVPIDKGPNTPSANAAYMGGGVILQGAPGAPAPTPEPTPPGQTPKNMVPP